MTIAPEPLKLARAYWGRSERTELRTFRLNIGNMTASASGTAESPGRNVAAKSGLNRGILEQGWGMMFAQLEYKAASAGIPFVRVNPARTSQTCADCGSVDPLSRKGTRFRCWHCGHTADADVNAARNILRRGLDALGLAGSLPARAAGRFQPSLLGPVHA